MDRPLLVQEGFRQHVGFSDEDMLSYYTGAKLTVKQLRTPENVLVAEFPEATTDLGLGPYFRVPSQLMRMACENLTPIWYPEQLPLKEICLLGPLLKTAFYPEKDSQRYVQLVGYQQLEESQKLLQNPGVKSPLMNYFCAQNQESHRFCKGCQGQLLVFDYNRGQVLQLLLLGVREVQIISSGVYCDP